MKQTLILYGLVAVLLFCLFCAISTCNRNEASAKAGESFKKALDDTTKYFTNKLGEVIATRSVAVGSTADVAKEEDLKALAKQFDTRMSRIQDYYGIIIKSMAKLQPTTEVVYGYDTSQRFDLGKVECPQVKWMEQEYNNKWYKGKARTGEGAYMIVQSTDSVYLVVKDTFTRKFLGRSWYSVINVLNKNPDSKIIIDKAYKIKNPQRTNYLSFQAEAGLVSLDSLSKISPYAGLNARYNFGRWGEAEGMYGKYFDGIRNNNFARLTFRLSLFRL